MRPPTTPATAGPEWKPMRTRIWPLAKSSCTSCGSRQSAARDTGGSRTRLRTSSISVATASMRAAWSGAPS
jgi:hypothetical protein